MKQYKFFFHYNKQKKMMSVHFRGQCYPVKHIICEKECQTKYNKRQPYLVMHGWAERVIVGGDLAEPTAVIR